MEIKYDAEAFQSFYNIPKYKRNADGTVSPMLYENGEPQMLITEEEVFESISLNALEANRDDLAETFKEAELDPQAVVPISAARLAKPGVEHNKKQNKQ